MTHVFKFIGKNKLFMFLCLVITILAGFTRAYGASYLQRIIDLINDGRIAGIAGLIVIGYLFMGSAYFFRWLSAVMTLYLTEKLALEIRIRLLAHLTKIPFGVYEKHTTGTLQSIFRNDAATASELLYNLFSRIGNNVFLFIFTFAYMLMLNVGVTLSVVAITLVMTFVNQKILDRLKAPVAKQRASLGNMTQITENALSSINTVKAYSAGGYILDTFNAERKIFSQLTMKATIIDHIIRRSISDIINNSTIYLSILYLGYLGVSGRIGVGEVIVFVYLIKQIMVPVEVVFRWMGTAVRAVVTWKRIDEILDIEIKEEEPFQPVKDVNQVSAKGITFSYDGNENVLENVNADFEKGYITRICGESGKGKTTLIKVLLGLYDCESAVYEINRKKREHITNIGDITAFAPAENKLFNLSIYDNLTFGDKSISKERIMKLAAELGVDQWLNSLPDGLDTVLSEAAENVSGGQGQMLNNMRGLLSGKEVIILDEPFSALDTHRESKLATVLNGMKDDKIIVITSHRKSEFLDGVREVVLGSG
ncbi:MAG: ABC transporter ATP-binding protein/permease [Defluviitaleaceae bacterium]|nr:ABC transporter ATP-binding protein/permease [Defluviitaleaceae bacterium]